MVPDREPIRVLHVDDDQDFADVAAIHIERAGTNFGVDIATSAASALERLGEGSVDCVVSDFDMPEMNGIEFLEAVRLEYPDLPFVLFTGKGSEEVASEAISAGVTDYIQKGAGTDQYAILANRIENAVTAHRAKQAIERSERRLRRVYERISDGFFAVNTSWEYTYVNETGADIVDRDRDELVDRRVWEAFPGLADSPFETALRTAMDSQETQTIEEYYPPHETWYDVSVYPAEDGISIYFRDVTEKHESRPETPA